MVILTLRAESSEPQTIDVKSLLLLRVPFINNF